MMWTRKKRTSSHAAMKWIERADWRPPVMRQYDGREVRRLFRDYERDGKAMLLMVHEGPKARVDAEVAAMHQICGAAGLEAGDPVAAKQWIEKRNHVPSWRDMFERGYVADMEQTEHIVREAIEQAERIAGLNIDDVWVSFSAGSLLSEQLKGEVEVDFAPVAGATLYNVEISRDPAFNDHRAGGEIKAPPLRARLQPGRYYARVSAIDSERLVGPPSPVREFSVITLRTDASIVGVPVQNGGPPSEKQRGAQLMLVRSLGTMLELSGVGQPLQVAIDNAPPVDCKSAHTFTLGPGEHHVRLRLADAESELLFSVAGPPPPAPVEYQARVEPIELPVPLVSPGFPGRSVQPRTRVYALLGLGSSLASRDLNVFRVDVGGELALLQRRLSFDVNVPLLYYTGLGAPGGLADDNAVAIGDVAVGARAVPLKAASGRFLLGPLLRVQLPTGSFDRTATLGRPVTIDPALGMAAQLGRLGLQTTQGLPATVNLAQSQLRWAMSYSAEVKVWRLSLAATLDAAIGLLGPSESGASLGGGVRLQLGPWNLLTGVRGGLGDGGAAVFGRYYYFLGVEWSPL